jgi:hypothetical protein
MRATELNHRNDTALIARTLALVQFCTLYWLLESTARATAIHDVFAGREHHSSTTRTLVALET